MGKTLRSPLRILAATSVAIFSLLAVFTSTAAWFDSTRNLNNGANEMQIRETDAFNSVSLYEAVYADKDNYYFSSTPVASSSQAIPMGVGDSPFKSDDPYHPILLIVEYTSAVDEAYVFASTNSSFICDTATEVSRNPLTQAEGNPLSSIVRFYSNGFASAIPTTTYEGNGAYHFTVSSLTSAWTNQSFVTPSGTSMSFNGRPCLYYSGETQVNRVAIIIEYNVDAINFISSYYMGNELLNEDISFVCDWTLEA